MPDNKKAVNPYLPPATDDHRSGIAGRSFQVGHDEIHTIFVETSLWTGLRTHSMDAAGNSTPVQRGVCQFEVGERERHQVAIQVDRTGRINALVDDKLVAHNLFPRVHTLILALVSLLILVIVSIALGLIFNA